MKKSDRKIISPWNLILPKQNHKTPRLMSLHFHIKKSEGNRETSGKNDLRSWKFEKYTSLSTFRNKQITECRGWMKEPLP